MINETTIQFGRPPAGVVLADPDAPLPAAATRAAREAAERRARTEADLRRAADPAEGREAIQRVLAGITEAARGLAAEERRRMAEMQQAAVELAIAVASRLIHDKVQSGDFAVESLVRRVVQQLDTRQLVSVYLHPDDIALLGRRLGSDRLLLDHNAEVRLVPDGSLGRGSCRAEAGEDKLLSQLEVQLAGIRQHLLRSIVNAGPGPGETVPGDRNLRPVSDRRQSA